MVEVTSKVVNLMGLSLESWEDSQGVRVPELCWKNPPNEWLVGGFNPSEKYACQIGSFPQVGVKIKNI